MYMSVASMILAGTLALSPVAGVAAGTPSPDAHVAAVDEQTTVVTRHVSLPNFHSEQVRMFCPFTHPRVDVTVPGNLLPGFSHVSEATSMYLRHQHHEIDANGAPIGAEVYVKNGDAWGRHLWTNLTLHCRK